MVIIAAFQEFGVTRSGTLILVVSQDLQQNIRFWFKELASSLIKQVQPSLIIKHKFESLLTFIVVEPVCPLSHRVTVYLD